MLRRLGMFSDIKSFVGSTKARLDFGGLVSTIWFWPGCLRRRQHIPSCDNGGPFVGLRFGLVAQLVRAHA